MIYVMRERGIGSRFLFFFNDTATTEIYTLSLHDALPICEARFAYVGTYTKDAPGGGGAATPVGISVFAVSPGAGALSLLQTVPDRKSTRLNSSHANISYAVFCLKKTKTDIDTLTPNTDDD